MLSKKQQCYKAPKTKSNRLNKEEFKKFQRFVYEIGFCQICNSKDLDTPHHSRYGSYKDDTSLICICRNCHYQIHHGTKGVSLSKEELQEIGKRNWNEFLKIQS